MLAKKISECKKFDVLGCENRVPILREETESSELVYERFNPGQGYPEWVHDDMEQTYYVLTGRALADVGGDKLKCGPGTVVYIPHYTRHTMDNASIVVDMEYMCLDASPDGWASAHKNNWDEHYRREAGQYGSVDFASLHRPQRPYKYVGDVTRLQPIDLESLQIIPALIRDETVCTELLHITVASGHSTRVQKHDEIETIFQILSGFGTLTVNGETAKVEPLMTIHVPRGARHSVSADWAPLVYISWSVAPQGWPKELARWEDALARYKTAT